MVFQGNCARGLTSHMIRINISILRYHGRWILTKKWEKINTFFSVQIEKTEINILQKKIGKKAFLLFEIEEKNYF